MGIEMDLGIGPRIQRGIRVEGQSPSESKRASGATTALSRAAAHPQKCSRIGVVDLGVNASDYGFQFGFHGVSGNGTILLNVPSFCPNVRGSNWRISRCSIQNKKLTSSNPSILQTSSPHDPLINLRSSGEGKTHFLTHHVPQKSARAPPPPVLRLRHRTPHSALRTPAEAPRRHHRPAEDHGGQGTMDDD